MESEVKVATISIGYYNGTIIKKLIEIANLDK